MSTRQTGCGHDNCLQHKISLEFFEGSLNNIYAFTSVRTTKANHVYALWSSF